EAARLRIREDFNMKRTIFCQCLALLLIGLMLWAGQNATVLAQSRRQPPTSDEKKNKRPDQEKPKEQEPLPTDILPGKPQEGETVKVTTNLVNVDAVVYNKKTSQITTGLKQGNFEIWVDGVKKEITNF